MLSNAAVLLLSALQPALSKPTKQSGSRLRTRNEVLGYQLTDTKIILSYLAPNPGCAAGVSAWVGIWPNDDANACNIYTENYKAWSYMEPTQGLEPGHVKFNSAELGAGPFKAAFFCDDDRRHPWMFSKVFKLDERPPVEKGQCVHRLSAVDPAWSYTPCYDAHHLCIDCDINGDCESCDECEKQCGQDN